jgi:caspase domain-containing protein
MMAMKPPDPTRSQAVLIAVGDYGKSTGLPPIPAAGNNARKLFDILTNPLILGLPSQQCRLILDPADDAHPALAVAQAAQETTDTLLVYFAGHGLVARSGELIFGLTGTSARWPEFTGLRYAWLREALVPARARRTVVIIDCCFSGRAISAMTDEESLVAGQLGVRGAYVMTSTSANAVASAPVGSEYTAFTGSLIELFTQGLSGGPPYLCLNDVYEWTRKSMIRAGLEQPLQAGTNQIGELPLLRNVAAPNGAGAAAAQPSKTTPHRRDDDVAVDLMVVLEIASYDALAALSRVDAQLAMIRVVDESARRAGLDPGSWMRHPLRNGELIVLPRETTPIKAVATMMRAMAEELVRLNHGLALSRKVQINATVSEDRPDEIRKDLILLPRSAAVFSTLPVDPRTILATVPGDHALAIVATGGFFLSAQQLPRAEAQFHPIRTRDEAPVAYLWTP